MIGGIVRESSLDFSKRCGTSLRGFVSAQYGVLVEMFGEPDFDQGEKVGPIWTLTLPSGALVTIYTYGPAGSEAIQWESRMFVSEWHIGAKKGAHVEEFAKAAGLNVQPFGRDSNW
jgi:hypothetical protein